MASSYPQRVAASILPLSVAGTLPAAFEEWSFANSVYDHEKPIETCELCDQEDLRYHFLIANTLTRKTLWVGSKCILSFGISVFEAGRRLGPKEAEKKLDRLTQQMRLDSCLKALERLASAESNDILRNALDYYRKKKVLSPKLAWVVFWRLDAQRIDHSPSFFKICLRRMQHKVDLGAMPTERVHLIWPALSSSQRQMALEMGHSPPAPPLPPVLTVG
jgi:hypothetical protein